MHHVPGVSQRARLTFQTSSLNWPKSWLVRALTIGAWGRTLKLVYLRITNPGEERSSRAPDGWRKSGTATPLCAWH